MIATNAAKLVDDLIGKEICIRTRRYTYLNVKTGKESAVPIDFTSTETECGHKKLKFKLSTIKGQGWKTSEWNDPIRSFMLVDKTTDIWTVLVYAGKGQVALIGPGVRQLKVVGDRFDNLTLELRDRISDPNRTDDYLFTLQEAGRYTMQPNIDYVTPLLKAHHQQVVWFDQQVEFNRKLLASCDKHKSEKNVLHARFNQMEQEGLITMIDALKANNTRLEMQLANASGAVPLMHGIETSTMTESKSHLFGLVGIWSIENSVWPFATVALLLVVIMFAVNVLQRRCTQKKRARRSEKTKKMFATTNA